SGGRPIPETHLKIRVAIDRGAGLREPPLIGERRSMRCRGARAGRGENENDGERHDEGEGEFSGMHDWFLLIEAWEFVRGVGQDHGHGPHAEMTARRSSMSTTPLALI